MTGPAKLAPPALLAITLLLGACESAAPQPTPTLLARGTFVIRDWDKVEFEATREGAGVSGRMTVGQNEAGPADILRVDLRCAGTTEDGLLMIGGHTVGAGGRFAGMPVGTFAAIALGREPERAAIWAGSGAWTPTTDCVANLDAWLTEERSHDPNDELWLRDDFEGAVEFGAVASTSP